MKNASSLAEIMTCRIRHLATTQTIGDLSSILLQSVANTNSDEIQMCSFLNILSKL